MGVQLPSEPITRKEQYLAKAAGQAVEIPAEPITREEAYLEAIANAGGGGGGTTNYNQLSNKPQIAGTTLQGNKSLSDLGIASATALGNVSNAVTAITDGQTINSFSDVETALSGKQATLTFDNVPTDGSTNPVESNGVYSALAGKQDTLTFDDVPTDNSNNPVKSNGIYDALALKQNATDNSLQTTDKTVVGAINEHEGDISSLKSGLTDYQTQNDLNLGVPNRKNLVKITASNEVWQGVNFVNNNNGTLTVTGSNTGNNPIAFIAGTVSLVNGENYKFTGCPSNGGSSSYRVDLRSGGTIYDNIIDEGSGYSFTARQDVTVDVCIRIAAGYSLPEGGLTFYPMIRPATITDPTFAPYIPSVESRIEAVESNKVDFRPYYAKANATTYSIPITRAAAYIISVNIPTGANTANPGLYYVVKQGTSVSKSDLITDVLGITATISDSNLVLAWTASNPYGANFTVIPVMEFN